MDVEGQGSTKRPAPVGTPDRETQASDLMPCTFQSGDVSATIATSRAVMSEEINTGMSALESRFTNKM